MITRVFLYDGCKVRTRMRGGELVWFTRDVAAALAVRFPAGPVLPESANSLPGIATAEQVWTLVRRAGCGAPDVFRAWMAEVGEQLAAQPSPPVPAPRRHLSSVQRTRVA
ncbi:hypothetical protein ACWGH2_41930 [Streptomyces sp. NPDC054871]